ncbi:hypothetical protein QWY93_09685 [Echinicola jeungdonensis]|uniref:Uncharacterized protein n=1 Tax=Echinicola jeungdonensis TaxID=709343 RepID=A0ABV5J3E2_9BACT|nr:hypothetical protein [Echinicola jeungdonensis]MDN3669599.1 hypothetical protein [Echinicola jeungdonensis]
MANKKGSFDEVEKLLQEIGGKIEELIAKGAELGGEAKGEVERKIEELRQNKESIHQEFKNRRGDFEKKYDEKKVSASPFFKKSGGHFKDGINELLQGFKAIFK